MVPKKHFIIKIYQCVFRLPYEIILWRNGRKFKNFMYVCTIIFQEKEMKKTILLFSVILTSLFAFANCDIDSLYNCES